VAAKLDSFSAHQQALELFDLVVADLRALSHHPALSRLIAQHIARADSIAARIAEGYGRGSAKDSSHFLVIARGAAHETGGRYQRLKHWLAPEVIAARVALCGDIIAILTASLNTLRRPQ
jgi:four helix bundle protein